MKWLILPMLIIIKISIINAQTSSLENNINTNSIYFEIGGNGGNLVFIDPLNLNISTMLTINYERKFLMLNNKYVAIRSGFGYIPQSWKNISIPIEISYFTGTKNHFFETGFGSTYLKEISSQNFSHSSFVFFGRIGYRLEIENGLLLRVGFTPVVDNDRVFFTNRFFINPFFGISIGYTF